jgi:thiol-disulfide isomerase/thioredoxin
MRGEGLRSRDKKRLDSGVDSRGDTMEDGRVLSPSGIGTMEGSIRMSNWKALSATLLLAVSGCVSCGRPVPETQQVKADSEAAAPHFKLVDLNGKEFDSSQLKGSVVVLDMWATWCAPCIADIPIFHRLQEKYGSRGLKIVAPAMQSGWAQDIRPVVEKHGMKYTILIGDEKLAEQYPYLGLPTTFLFDRNGRIAKKFIGTVPDQEGEKEGEFEREIQRLLKTS